ncbi:MAG: dihydropteroate synthase [Verrucomicrobiae bacterium]|nr:dihydropteroate synthase [Verrucomicrobiae bacterium]
MNVTPDSFSDGGRYLDVSAAEARAHEMVAEGADIIDIGGESTRPYAAPVEESEELRRVMPVIERLSGKLPAVLSIDTRKPGVARAALAAGVEIVNDVEANRIDAEMWKVVAEYGAGYVCVHMQGTPQTMQQNPCYDDVVREVGEFFEDRLTRLTGAGVNRVHVALAPGIGFGKTLEHNLQLLAWIDSFRRFLRPLVIGVSRKSFIGKLLGVEVEKRLPASLACAVWCCMHGAAIVRTHDVGATWQALRMIESLTAERGK